MRFFHSLPPPLFITSTVAVVSLAAIAEFSLTYGVLFPASAFLAWKLKENRAAHKIIVLFVVCILSHACIRLLIADNVGAGDRAEINRKTFVWPYFMIVFCTSTLILNYVNLKKSEFIPRMTVLIILLSCFFALSVFSARKLQEWPGASHIKSPIPRGLFESAAYLRQHSSPGEVVQLCKNDVLNQLSSLAERPVFIANYEAYRHATTLLEQQRFTQVDEIVKANEPQTAALRMCQAKISWLLMSPECKSPWESQIAPALSVNGYRLYQDARIQ